MNWSSVLVTAAQNPTGGAAPQGGGGLGILPFVAGMILLFYFMVLRPQKRDQKRVQDMRETISKGDRVKSIGGIYGTVTAVDTTNNIVSVQVDRNVKIDFDRNAIATVTKKDEVRAAKEQAKVEAPAVAAADPVSIEK